jgi:hypothetical protein
MFNNQELARVMTALIISEGLPRPRDCPLVPKRSSEEILAGMQKKYRWMRTDVKEKGT